MNATTSALRVLVVDDEALARRNLVVMLAADPDVADVVECETGMQAVERIRAAPPDLVFLDIQMPECGGFDVLEMLGGELPTVIFVTAYDEYALRAFEAGALDYLLKPFDDARFHRALGRAKARIARDREAPPATLRRLVVKNRGQTLFIDPADIDWIEAAGYYAGVHVGADTHIVRRSLNDLERDLGPAAFVRTHRSTLVNVARIHMLELQDGGEYAVLLRHSNVRLPLSRRYRAALQRRLGVQAGASGGVATLADR